MKRWMLTSVAALLMPLLAQATPPFREDTVTVEKSSGLFGTKIETQIYAPQAEGKFPMVVINHGHFTLPAAADLREVFRGQALEFVKRGYVVVVPYRPGYSHSSGDNSIRIACFNASVGRQWADDVNAAIDYARGLPNVDGSKIVVLGHSQGGFTSVALGAMNVPGVLGVVNFVGAAKQPHCQDGYGPATDSFASFGKTSTVPALFVYGDNDDYGSAAPADSVPHAYLKAYNDAGGHATLYDYGTYGRDSHVMFSHQDGVPIWEPPVGQFFKSLGLNWDVRYPMHVRYAWSRTKSQAMAAGGNVESGEGADDE
ncbi:dienelactone hydrolase family protein [Paraburkholderia sp. D15]|uniref:dienelactone hydrolase family protein n=1 Tax=Paraburkholderia sp. D15 TaxID=2880218 RepID=UPI00247A4C0A|nr:CocE/NonD family hydrolase [Paraburkholderia sp. D15]WGS53757.1 dienelactone hydrolase family protein [Paraburkholderia sp. D15]